MRKDRRRDVKIRTKISSFKDSSFKDSFIWVIIGYTDSLRLVGRYCTVPTFFD